ncbi:MAG: VCBS repeat-containing protein, partial [Deltaproteobacteria bacterium]|nr:VCBS repeat-containing protein [Deltaproteobacteria bacterium]
GFTCDADFCSTGTGCIADTDLDHCGPTCLVCPAVADATRTCDGTGCGFTCDADFCSTGTGCVADTDLDHCGPTCLVCPAVADATRTCDGTGCGFTCDADYHRCGDRCDPDPDTNVAACGPSCAVCFDPLFGGPTCTGGVCGLSCWASHHVCGGDCVSDSDPQNCGPTACVPCEPPANATATCNGTSCDFACDAGFEKVGAVCAPLPPRPKSPLSTSTTTTRRPVFSWELVPGTTGAKLEICATRACTAPLVAELTGDVSVRVPFDLPGGVYYWRLYGMAGADVGSRAGVLWQVRIPAIGTGVDSAGLRALDLNADGLADVAVSSDVQHKVFVHVTADDGAVPTTATATLTGPATMSFGKYVATAGDVNGDGYGDLITGGNNPPRIYFGAASGGVSATTLDLKSCGRLGVAGLGDVNGDGYGDVAVAGSPQYVSEDWKAFVFYGSKDGPNGDPVTLQLSVPTPLVPGDVAVGNLGDVNGDGFADLVVGESYSTTGRAWIYLGSAEGIGSSGTSLTTPPASAAWFGNAVGGADVNGDGYADAIIGAPEPMSSGLTPYVAVYHGSSTGISTTHAVKLTGVTNMQLGRSVSGAGTLTDDVYEEVIVGAPGTAQAFVYYGSASGLSAASVAILSSSYSGGEFGVAVAGAGDVNGDGLGDVLVGERYAYIGDCFTYSGDQGAVHLYLGAASSVTTPATTNLLGVCLPYNGAFGTGVARWLPRLLPRLEAAPTLLTHAVDAPGRAECRR